MLTSKTHTVVFIALREVIRSREKYIQTIEHLIESLHETIILGLGLLLGDRRDIIGLITSLRRTLGGSGLLGLKNGERPWTSPLLST